MTYRETQDEYKRQHGKTVKSCWIAHIKRDYSKTRRRAHNRGSGQAKYLCSSTIYPRLEKIMKQCGMI